MAQELKRHNINELIGMIKLKGGIGYPIVYYANEVDAVVAKRDSKIGKLTDKLSKTSEQIKRLADLAHVRNTELAQIGKLSAEKDKEIRRLQRALWLARAGEAAKEVNYWTCENESSYAIVDFNVHHKTIVSYKAPHHRPYKWILIWENVERKCRAKAEQYK